MFLRDVENNPNPPASFARMVEQVKSSGQAVPEIWYLFAFKTEVTDHLARFTQAVMRGPSPLSAGMRELIAAFTSKKNHCPF